MFATQAELDACGVEPGLAFDYDCYVQVGCMFFSPAVVSVEELQRLQEARGTEGMRSVRTLNLKERARGAAGMEALAKALPQLSGLQHLDLGGNEICTLPVELGQLACLRTLDMSRNNIHTLPDAVCRGLAQLEELNVNSNRLVQLPGALLRDLPAVMPRLRSLDCRVNPRLSEIAEQDGTAVATYLRAAIAGGAVDERVLIILVGNGESGKTSWKLATMSPTNKAPKIDEATRTVGVEMTTWDLRKEHGLEFMFLDLAGQAVYRLTNQVDAHAHVHTRTHTHPYAYEH